MVDLARIYRALIKAQLATIIEYRAQVIIWILSFLFPLVMLAVWLALVDEAGPIAGWGSSDFVSYYVGATLVNYMTSAFIVWDWDEDIRTGTLSIKLLKPVDPFHHHLTNELGWKLFIFLFFVPLVSLAAWLLPAIHYPLSFARLMVFAFSLLAGFALNMMMSSAFGVLAFWSTQVGNLYGLWNGAGQFLSGWIAPLALFPAGLRQVAYWLPFRSTLSFPMEILMGHSGPFDALSGFAITFGWILVFGLTYRILWRLGLARYEAVGG